MLPLSIILLVAALVVAGFATYGVVGVGAMFFAAGFLILALMGILHVVRARVPTVF